MARIRRSKTEKRSMHRQHASLLEALAISQLANADDDDKTLLGLAIGVLALEESKLARTQKYGSRGSYDQLKSNDFYEVLLHRSSECQFKAWFWMTQEAFWHVHDLVHHDPIFISTGKHPQRAVHYQLSTFLCHLGGESGIKVASVMSIAEGTAYLYFDRNGHLAWPGERRQDFLSSEMTEWGFPGCIGIADGSYILLMYKPIKNGYAYWCCKKYYALIVQATCDHRAIFTSYDFGWPGSVQDSCVFKNSHLWQHRDEYFRTHEYILVDKASMTLHNLFEGFGDDPTTIKGFNGREEEDVVEVRGEGPAQMLGDLNEDDLYRVVPPAQLQAFPPSATSQGLDALATDLPEPTRLHNSIMSRSSEAVSPKLSGSVDDDFHSFFFWFPSLSEIESWDLTLVAKVQFEPKVQFRFSLAPIF
ncbi:hypothetical protein BDN67DRAFT_1031877 [Paxillus ammoniavirescens]|nr:hypothetical protein BDN67DRAFT_1031877 [Paxillus ammoniavirescens]